MVHYGTSLDSLDMESSEVDSISSSPGTDESYEVDLTGLTPDTTYYYQVVTTLKGFTFESSIDTFETLEIGKSNIATFCPHFNVLISAPSAAPTNFEATLENTVISFTWGPVEEDQRNGVIAYYTLRCSIDSEKVFSLNLTYTVEEITVGVYETSSTYTCTISASTLAGEGPTASDSVATGGEYFTHPL